MEDHNKMLQRVVLLFVFVFLFLFLAMAGGEDGDSSYDSSSYDGIVVTQADLQALQAFKASLQDPHGALRSWNDSGAGACSGGWLGIKCVRGQVIAIQIPWRGLSGRIAEQVGQLTALRKLNLHDNDLQGPVPSSLAYLRSLRGVYLFNNRLSGIIPPGICNSPVFQALDLRNNLLSGPLPGGLGKSPNLYRVNLSFNNLTGPLPPDLLGSRALVFLHLGRNRFSGALPASVGNMKKLRELGLAHNLLSASSLPAQLGNATSLESLDLSFNSFQGSLPGTLTELGKLKAMNVSYNNLTGPVPPALARKFAPSSFEGNPGLCGYDSAHSCPPSAPSPAPAAPAAPSRRHRRRTLVLVLIIVGSVLGFLILLSLVALLCFCLRRRSEEAPAGGKAGAAAGGPVSGSGSVETGEVDGKLVHFDGPLVFTADDLLCATAEIMGKSTYGTVYKATLEDGNQVAVKRLRERIAKGQREFEAEANALGKIRHPNLLALRAYYWGPKDAKLLVFDYMPNGSLAAFLHARGPETPLNWATRHRIALGAARGLAHLHSQLNIIHGNLNASNILLDSNLNAKIADFGLARLMIPAANNNVIATASALGYKAPELTKVKKANTKTDVYSFGIVLLELLTGKSPAEPMSSENGDMDLPEWVASIVKEQWTNEVFDMEIINESTTGEELIQTLQLAMHCVDPTPSLRPEMDEVVQQLELTGPEPSQQQ